MSSGHEGTLAGTAGGTLLAVLANLHLTDLVDTAVLAGTGAVVSFLVSVGLRWILRKVRQGR